MRQSREELMSLLRADASLGQKASAPPAAALSDATARSGVVSDAPASSNRCTRVSFAPDVTVKEIRSCFSFTAEEKHRLYRDMRTLEAEADKSWKECMFEGSRHCCDNALEEKFFFPNHLGELVHPAHFLPYTRGVLPYLVDVVSVPGFSSFDAFLGYLTKYALMYDAAKRHGLFDRQQS